MGVPVRPASRCQSCSIFAKDRHFMNQILPTDFLTANSTFLGGVATAINIGGNFYDYNRSPSSVEADAYAIASDWIMVGEDMRKSIATDVADE